MIRQGFGCGEPPFFVKRLRRIILGVGEKCPRPDRALSLKEPNEGILQKAGSEPLSLKPNVNRKTGQKDERNWVPSEPLLDSLRRMFELDRRSAEAVKPDDHIRPRTHCDKRPRRVISLILEGVLSEEYIELVRSAVKSAQIMLFRQADRAFDARIHSNTLLRAKRSLRLAGGAVSSSRSSRNWIIWASGSRNRF